MALIITRVTNEKNNFPPKFFLKKKLKNRGYNMEIYPLNPALAGKMVNDITNPNFVISSSGSG